jgi:hypothetical protein
MVTSTDPWQRLALGLGYEPAADARVEHDLARPLRCAKADDRGLGTLFVCVQGLEHGLRMFGAHAQQRLSFVGDV